MCVYHLLCVYPMLRIFIPSYSFMINLLLPHMCGYWGPETGNPLIKTEHKGSEARMFTLHEWLSEIFCVHVTIHPLYVLENVCFVFTVISTVTVWAYSFDLAGRKCTCLKERVHSEMKISYKIKLDPSIMPFAFFFSKNVSIPSDINSSPKIPLPGPALSLPGTCIITSRDLHYCFRGLAFSLPGPSLLLPGPALSLPGPALSLPGPALLLPDLHYFAITKLLFIIFLEIWTPI